MFRPYTMFDCPSWPPPMPEVTQELLELVASGEWAKYQSAAVQRLRDAMAETIGVRHVRLVCSGSAAVELALRGCGVGMPLRQVGAQRQAAVGPQEVICPALDYPGNVRAVRLLGAEPVLVDSLPGGWTIDLEAVVAAGTPRTIAVIASHLYGEIAAVAALREICDRRGWMLVEDVCQMPGGRWDGQPLGSFGHVAAWSFGGSKPLTAGCGGAVTTDDDRIAQRLAAHSDRPSDAYPLSPLQAAALWPQWRALGDFAVRQRARWLRLQAACRQQTPCWQWPVLIDSQHQPVFYKLPILVAQAPAANSQPGDTAAGGPIEMLVAAAQASGVPASEAFRIPRASARSRGRIMATAQAQAIAARLCLIDHRVLAGSEADVDQLAAVLIELHQRLYEL